MFGAADPSPRDHAAVLRPCERDVQEPHRFRELLDPRDGPGPLVRVEVEDLPVARLRVQVVGDVPFVAAPPGGGVPGEGAEHDGELQALGRVHGQDPDQRLVALEPELGALVHRPAPGGGGSAAAQPGGKLRRSEPASGLRFLQEFGEVPEVREPAHPARPGEKTLRAALPVEQLQQDRADAARLPLRAPARDPLRPPAPCRLVLAQGVQRGGVEPEQGAGQRPAYPGLPPRLDERPQQALDLLRLVRLEHAAVVDLDAAHPARAQRFRDQPALGAGADQHRDVRAGERFAADRGLAAHGPSQQARDLVRGRLRGDPARVLLRAMLSGFLRVRQEPEFEGCTVSATAGCGRVAGGSGIEDVALPGGRGTPCGRDARVPGIYGFPLARE